jgi:hypothetical protein
VQAAENKRYFFVIQLRASMIGGVGGGRGRVGNFKVLHTAQKMATT